MTMDPLKSAMSIGNVEETSLALPSDNQLRSKQQRVLEQVQTIKRGKSRYGKNGSGFSPTQSPTSPQFSAKFSESVKSPSNLNGNVFFNSSTGQNTLSKTLIKEQNTEGRFVTSKGSTLKNETASHQWKRHTVSAGQNNSSRSVPDMGHYPTCSLPPLWTNKSTRQMQPNRHSLYAPDSSRGQFISNSSSPGAFNGNGLLIKASKYIGLRSTKCGQVSNSQVRVEDFTSTASIGESKNVKSKSEVGLTSNGQIADITMKEAVDYLSSADSNYQHCGASFIQHSTFSEDKAKKEVLRLKGIPTLVNLLKSPSSQVQQTVSAALRNLAFKDADNKEEVHNCGGITESLTLLRETNCSETQKQLTGLLWNLSSADSLKPDLVCNALPVLMDTVIVPYTAGTDKTSNQDPESFYHATACLRNLSCAKKGNRQTMRNCRGLVDSLVSYIQSCVEAGNADDKSLENCVCVLHNLSFQLESEAPSLFSKINALAKPPGRASETGPIGCFSPQSSKVQEQESHFDFPVMEDQNPKGAGWLFHSKTMESYLALLQSSQREDTLEASCGAMQNLTASPGIVSRVISQNIVQKLNGLPQISPLLQSTNPGIQKAAVALVGNLAKNPCLQSKIARQTLQDLVGIIRSNEGTESDDTLAMVCQTCNSLLFKEPVLGKSLLSNIVVNRLGNLSKNSQLPKASKAAGVLLYSLWSEKDMQSYLKRHGMNKSMFVNDVTSLAHRSMQVVE
ncbi:hypothetical protein UPYG_G00175120 [Umbra pygmaea]|uniref:Plakophilin 1 n=1 Tax=Umbra pygmaea TaxID=75934 RepID=A0ABD0XET5_UMBPY